MATVAMIPARYAATRFPGKLMQQLGDKSVIAHTYLATQSNNIFDEVYVVTDSDIIEAEILKYGGKVLRSNKAYECGTDRIAAVCQGFSASDIIINIQGDEPFTKATMLQSLVTYLQQNDDIQVASFMQVITDADTIHNPNTVKVVVDNQCRAMLFSRAAIPYHRDTDIPATYYKHIGIYGFKQAALLQFSQWPQSKYELIEKQEGMRFLENNMPIYMLETTEQIQGIDTPEDLIKATAMLSAK